MSFPSGCSKMLSALFVKRVSWTMLIFAWYVHGICRQGPSRIETFAPRMILSWRILPGKKTKAIRQMFHEPICIPPDHKGQDILYMVGGACTCV